MAVNSYPKGTLVVCTGQAIVNATGLPGDPTTTLFGYRDGAGIWHLGLPVTRLGTGLYTATIDTSVGPVTGLSTETWYYAFYTPSQDPTQGANQTEILVVNPGLRPTP